MKKTTLCLIQFFTLMAMLSCAQNTSSRNVASEVSEDTFLWYFSPASGKLTNWMAKNKDVYLKFGDRGEIRGLEIGTEIYNLEELKEGVTIYPRSPIEIIFQENFSEEDGGQLQLRYRVKGVEEVLDIYIDKFDGVWIPYSVGEGSYMSYNEYNQNIDEGNLSNVMNISFSWAITLGIESINQTSGSKDKREIHKVRWKKLAPHKEEILKGLGFPKVIAE